MTPLQTATIQTAVLAGISNVLAQVLKCYKSSTPVEIDFTPVLHFVLFTAASTPPNFQWQQQLETWFPAQVADKKAAEKTGEKKTKTRLSKTNTAKKFLVDQVLGAPVNTALFLAVMGWFRGLAGDVLLSYVRQEFWPLMVAGWKLWPAVSIISFSVVPADKRVVFGSLIALGWNIYLGMIM